VLVSLRELQVLQRTQRVSLELPMMQPASPVLQMRLALRTTQRGSLVLLMRRELQRRLVHHSLRLLYQGSPQRQGLLELLRMLLA
jgi:hypothetical protein